MPLNLDNQLSFGQTAPVAQPANPPSAFVFKEDIGANAITVSLEDTDTPFGFPREVTGFESGGKTDVAEGGIYNPGSPRVVLQMMAVRQTRMVIKGAFRDKIRAGAQRQTQNSPEPNHARAMRDTIELVRQRGNPLKITWFGDERSGVLEETKFGEEGRHDITYELTFIIAVPTSGYTQTTNQLVSATPSIEDLRSQMAANLATQRAQLAALAANAAAVAAISNSLGFLASAIDTLGTFTTTAERVVVSTPQQLQNSYNSVIASAQNAQAQAQAVRDAGLDWLEAEDAMKQADADSLAAWWDWQTTTQLVLDQIIDAMRQVRLQSLQQLRLATRLYRVQPGDSLESIALSQLGSRARASDLGVRADQLVTGAYVRIPQAV